jgi:hypothetical protein
LKHLKIKTLVILGIYIDGYLNEYKHRKNKEKRNYENIFSVGI